MNNTKRIVLISLLVAGGAVIGFLESLLPVPLPIPGFRLGLSNVVVLVSLLLFGFESGIAVATLKSVIVMFLTGSVTAMFYSITGALLASIMMGVVLKLFKENISLIGVSLTGAFFHNLGQVAVASIIIKSTSIFAYLPVLLALGVMTGIFVGLCAKVTVQKLRASLAWLREGI